MVSYVISHVSLEQSDTDLTSESIQKFDGVDSENGVNRSGCCLKIAIYVLAKKLDNVDEMIGRCDSKLMVSVADRSIKLHTCCVDPLDAIEVRR